MHSILMIGCGGLGKCLLELNLLCNFIPKKYKGRDMRNIVIIEPEDLGEYSFYKKYTITHIKKALSKNNIKTTLQKYIPGSIIVLDVSIGVNAMDIIKVCNEYNVMYVNTSLENWEIDEPHLLPTSQKELYPRTLMYQYKTLMKEKEKIKSTMVFDHGMNPGMISHLAKFAIFSAYEYAYHRKISFTQKSLSKAAQKLKVDTIHVSELDTQKLKKSYPFQKNTFYNTWSGMGMIAEGLDPIQVGHTQKGRNAVDEVIGKKGYTYQNIKYYPLRGISKTLPTVAISKSNKEITFEGFLIPHGEANTLSRYLTVEDHAYTPNVYYVYRPSEPTLLSLEILKERNYKHQPHIHPVLDQRHLAHSGYDSIGANLIFGADATHPLGKYDWWTGTVLSMKDVKKMGLKYAGPTETQVAISFLACVKWMLENPAKGVCSPEDLPSLKIIEWCKPYLGTFVNRKIQKVDIHL